MKDPCLDKEIHVSTKMNVQGTNHNLKDGKYISIIIIDKDVQLHIFYIVNLIVSFCVNYTRLDNFAIHNVRYFHFPYNFNSYISIVVIIEKLKI